MRRPEGKGPRHGDLPFRAFARFLVRKVFYRACGSIAAPPTGMRHRVSCPRALLFGRVRRFGGELQLVVDLFEKERRSQDNGEESFLHRYLLNILRSCINLSPAPRNVSGLSTLPGSILSAPEASFRVLDNEAIMKSPIPVERPAEALETLPERSP